MNRIESGMYLKARGVSLIELMIAIAIGSILLLGLVQVFSASRAAYNTSEGMARVQENGRFAIDYLQRDIRMAGHFGCANDQAHEVKGTDDLENHLGSAFASLDFNVSIMGYEATGTTPGDDLEVGGGAATWAPGLPGEITSLNPSAGSDIIALRYLVGEGVPVTGLTQVGASPTATTNVEFPSAREDALTSHGVAAPTLFAVSDCSQVDVFSGSIEGNVVESDIGDFAGRYGSSPAPQTLLYRAESIVYYVAPGASGQPSLWRARADENGAYPSGGREELIEGIDSLQFLYGRDSTAAISSETPPAGNIIRQDTAGAIGTARAEWLRVGLVQVGVLAASPSRAGVGEPASNDQQPRVLGVRFAPPSTPDARYRNSYEVTVAVRNRLFGN